MNIKRAKEEIRNTIEAYLLKNEYGEYEIPVMAQRPIFLIGAPGTGKPLHSLHYRLDIFLNAGRQQLHEVRHIGICIG